MRVFHNSLNGAGETRSDARVASEGPRDTVMGHLFHRTPPFPVGQWENLSLARLQNAPFTVGRGPVPRQAALYRKLAGDRPPRYGNRTVSEPKNGPFSP